MPVSPLPKVTLISSIYGSCSQGKWRYAQLSRSKQMSVGDRLQYSHLTTRCYIILKVGLLSLYLPVSYLRSLPTHPLSFPLVLMFIWWTIWQAEVLQHRKWQCVGLQRFQRVCIRWGLCARSTFGVVRRAAARWQGTFSDNNTLSL